MHQWAAKGKIPGTSNSIDEAVATALTVLLEEENNWSSIWCMRLRSEERAVLW